MSAQSQVEKSAKTQKLKKLLAQGMNRKKALMARGYKDSTAHFRGKEIWARLINDTLTKIDDGNKLTVSDHLERLGYDDKSIAKVLADGLKAKKMITSPTEPDREYPDHPTRGQFVDRVAKLIGRDYYKDPKLKVDHSGSVTHRYESIIALITDQDSDEDFIDIEISDPN